MNRRDALKRLLAITAGTTPLAILGQSTWEEFDAVARGQIPFKLPHLPYGYDALEPDINSAVMQTHYLAIHASYVTNLNKALDVVRQLYLDWKYEGYFSDQSGEPIVRRANSLPETLRSSTGEQAIPADVRKVIAENACGHYNHSIFWSMLSSNRGEPSGKLLEAITKQFGSFEEFKARFTLFALDKASNGWVWLTLDAGRLGIEVTVGEVSPVASGRAVLLGIDLWEHAYAAQYSQNRRAYVKAWFNVINWGFVARRYASLTTAR